MKGETNLASQCVPDMRSNCVYFKHLISGKTLHPGTFTMKLAIKWDPKYSDLISKMTIYRRDVIFPSPKYRPPSASDILIMHFSDASVRCSVFCG